MGTWTDVKTKLAMQAKTTTTTQLTQLYEDWNTGHRLFTAKFARYYARKQAFTSLVASQSLYQVPVDSVRTIEVVVSVSSTQSVPLRQVRDEEDWRRLKFQPVTSNWPTHYFNIGDDLIEIWPTPSTSRTSGIRYVYQPFSPDLSIDDTTTGTVTVTNGSVTVTNSSNNFNTDMGGLWFQVTGLARPLWYEIVSATTTVLTLKSPYADVSGSGKSYRVGQKVLIPQEYQDAPMHYALGMFYSGQGNEGRAQYHLGTAKKPGMFYQMIADAEAEYASSSQSSLMTEGDETGYDPWFISPPAGTF